MPEANATKDVDPSSDEKQSNTKEIIRQLRCVERDMRTFREVDDVLGEGMDNVRFKIPFKQCDAC